ncbi:midasin-like [Fopius arisanus]|uniref:Centrosomal protein kizuna n=1 Tax=Fopius arisanus TaxID=64838 RepID=A0A9R1TCF2_9HYME|nr:PREDICTED: midasin-like [Fopius arisanus]
MTPLFDSQDYYKKMLELQEKLRKSEEERIRLEERFNHLEQESRTRHEACINKLRMRYIEFLEEERLRDERNTKLLGALDRVDSSLALMSAKTDKLQSLRKEYEASILRASGSRRTPSMAGDSGILSQGEDRRLFKPHLTPSPSLCTLVPPRRTQTYSRPLSYPSRPTLDFHERFPTKSRDLNDTWCLPRLKLPEEPLRAPRYLPQNSSPFQYPEISPLRPSKMSSLLIPKLEDEETGNAVENELERYISKIRTLHGEQEQSQEDHEQNTSGDLLNVTLSDDGLDHLPQEEKQKIPERIEKVLALAEDLAAQVPPEIHADTNLSEIQEENSPQEVETTKSTEGESPENIEPDVHVPQEVEVQSPVILLETAEKTDDGIDGGDEIEELKPLESLQEVQDVVEIREGVPGESEDAGDVGGAEEARGNNIEESGGSPEVKVSGEDVGQENSKAEDEKPQEPYQGDYQETPGYDYNQGENYQYPEGYQYNYDGTGQMEGYAGEYQGENYSPGYQESYPEGENPQYSQGNYGEGAGEYQEGTYEADPNAQYQEGSYPQEYQGEYPTEGQGYDPSYGYSYGQGYQGYQETPQAPEQVHVEEPKVEDSKEESRVEDTREIAKKKKDVIKSILESETESSIERNTENTESDFDFN